MMTLLTSGKHAAGKQNVIKEIFILPQPGTPMQKVQMYEYALSVVIVLFSHNFLVPKSKHCFSIFFQDDLNTEITIKFP